MISQKPKPQDSDINSSRYTPKRLQKALLKNPDTPKKLKERCENNTGGRKLPNWTDPLDIEVFNHLLVAWDLFVQEQKDASKSKKTGNQNAHSPTNSFPIDQLFSDLENFFQQGVPFTKEDQVNAIFCLHAMEINDLLEDDYQITREVPCFRTDSDQMREEDSRPKIDPKHKARADLLISDSSNLPLFLIELKILQSKDLKDGFEIGADTVAGIGNLKQGKTNADELLISAVEQVKSYWNFSQSDYLLEVKIPRYAVLALPNGLKISECNYGYFGNKMTSKQNKDINWLQQKLCLRRQVELLKKSNLSQSIIIFQANFQKKKSYSNFCEKLDNYEYYIQKPQIPKMTMEEKNNDKQLREVKKELKKKNLSAEKKLDLKKRESSLKLKVEKLSFDRKYMTMKLKNSDLEIQTPSDLKKIPIQVLLKVKDGFDWPRLKNLVSDLTIVYDSKPKKKSAAGV